MTSPLLLLLVLLLPLLVLDTKIIQTNTVKVRHLVHEGKEREGQTVQPMSV